jgi:hypothetical protein
VERATSQREGVVFCGALFVVTQCIFIQITTTITPKDPMTVRATKQRSKKSIWYAGAGSDGIENPSTEKAADQIAPPRPTPD